MIFSPVMVLGLIFPQFKSYTKQWWDHLLAQAFFAPAYLFLLYISLFVADQLQGSLVGGKRIGDTLYRGVTDPSEFTIVLYFFMVCIFMLASLTIAKKMSVAGANHATSITQGAARRLGGAVSSGTGRFSRSTLGWAADRVANSSRLKAGAIAGNSIDRWLLSNADKLRNASFDARATTLGQRAKLGSPQKGGYAQRQKDLDKREKRMMDLATAGAFNEDYFEKHAGLTVEGNDAAPIVQQIRQHELTLEKDLKRALRARLGKTGEEWERQTNIVNEKRIQIAALKSVKNEKEQRALLGNSAEAVQRRTAIMDKTGLAEDKIPALFNFQRVHGEMENLAKQEFVDTMENFTDGFEFWHQRLYRFFLRSSRQEKSLIGSLNSSINRSKDKNLSALDALNTSVRAGNNN